MRFPILFAATLLIEGAATCAGQATAELVSPTAQIPRGTYKVKLGIPAKLNAYSEGNPNGVPE